MDTFDEIFDKAKTFVDIASKKTSDAVELARLKMNRMQLNGEMQKTYEKLGAFVYKFHKSGQVNQELIDICIAEIDELLKQMDDIADRINEIKSSIKCPECGAVNDDEAIYCAKCGSKMPVAPDPAEEPVSECAPVVIELPSADAPAPEKETGE